MKDEKAVLMTERLAGWVFPILAIAFLTPWPIAYAYDNQVSEPNNIQIQAAGPSSSPGAVVFGKAIGSISPGHIFYVDASRNPADFTITLYLSNAQELIHYRYMILEVGVYAEEGSGNWERAPAYGDAPIQDTFITLHNPQVNFTVMGGAKYRVTIDGGSFCSTGASSASRSPRFYLTVD